MNEFSGGNEKSELKGTEIPIPIESLLGSDTRAVVALLQEEAFGKSGEPDIFDWRRRMFGKIGEGFEPTGRLWKAIRQQLDQTVLYGNGNRDLREFTTDELFDRQGSFFSKKMD